jgi:hypothetical protein
LGRKARISIVLLIAIVVTSAYLVGTKLSSDKPVEFDFTSEPGKTTIGLASEPHAVSPGCGCMYPDFGKLPWYGMSVPSDRFDLGVAASDYSVDPHLWALTAMAPGPDETNWLGVPTQSLQMKVMVYRNGRQRTIFNKRATHFVLWTHHRVEVTQPPHNPYAAVLPAANGSTTFRSHEASRSELGGSIDISTSTPERPTFVSSGPDHLNPEMMQRGPMIDVLGPRIRFSTRYSRGLRLWAALHEIKGFKPGDLVTVVMRVPFSLRLIPSPVQLDWKVDLPGAWPMIREEGDNTPGGPRAQGRFLLTEPLPPYVVNLRNVSVPSASSWHRFARRSAHHVVVKPMLQVAPMDRWQAIVEQYGLPPVSKRAQIGVFGRISYFESNDVSGRAVIGSKARPIATGTTVSFHSHDGLGAGVYRLTPLVSSGQTTDLATISGAATVTIGGDAVTHVAWPSLIPLAPIEGAIVGLIVAGVFAWARKHPAGNAS